MKLMGESLCDLERVTILSFDEMKVYSMYEYDQKGDEVVGPHSYMQVVMARGLFSKRKQVVYVGFDQKMTKSILEDIVTHLYNISFNVVGIVSDCGGTNIGLWKELNITTEKVYFQNPVSKSKIYVFADAPHLLKLTRNWLIDTGFTLGDSTIINKTQLEALIAQTDTEVSSCYKLRQKRLNCRQSERQNVSLAAQLLSPSTAMALKHYGPGPSSKLANDVGNFIEMCNAWFDIMNSFYVNANIHTKKPNGLDLERQNEIISCFQAIGCTGKTVLQTFQKGLLISCQSLQLLFQDLKEKYDIKYILTHRLNQDVLENFFSQEILCHIFNLFISIICSFVKKKAHTYTQLFFQ